MRCDGTANRTAQAILTAQIKIDGMAQETTSWNYL